MEFVTDFFDGWIQNETARRLLIIGAGVVLVLLIRGLAHRTLNRTIKDTSNRYRARKAFNFFAYFLMISVALVVYSDRLGNVGMALGLAGAGIAFALQEVIVSLAGWLHIVLAGTVSAGQRVKIGDVQGDIIDIGIFSTTIMEMGDWVQGDLYNGRIVSLSNGFIFKEKIHNYSAEYPFLWDELRLPIRTETDYELARSISKSVLEEVCGDYARQSKKQWLSLANKFRVEEARVEPMVTLEFDENWITLTLRYIVDFKKRRTTKDVIFTRLLHEVKKTNGKVQIASSSIEVTQMNA